MAAGPGRRQRHAAADGRRHGEGQGARVGARTPRHGTGLAALIVTHNLELARRMDACCRWTRELSSSRGTARCLARGGLTVGRLGAARSGHRARPQQQSQSAALLARCPSYIHLRCNAKQKIGFLVGKGHWRGAHFLGRGPFN